MYWIAEKGSYKQLILCPIELLKLMPWPTLRGGQREQSTGTLSKERLEI